MADEYRGSLNDSTITVSKSDILDAFERTEETIEDFEFRYSPWHYIEIDGERKPVKNVFLNAEPVSEVADSRSDFTTNKAEEFLEALGFEFYNKQAHASEMLRETLIEILENYSDRPSRATKDKRLYQLLVNKAPNLAKHVVVGNTEFDENEFNFRGTAGQGNWPDIPWFGILDPEETDTIQEGVYIVYLFDPENKRVYLTLNQGVTRLKQELGKREAKEELRRRAEEIREKVSLEGFSTEDPELEGKRADMYNTATIYQTSYELGNFPGENKVQEDLLEIIRVYKKYVASTGSLGEDQIGKDLTALAEKFDESFEESTDIEAEIQRFRNKFPESELDSLSIDEWAPRNKNPNKEDAVYYWLQYEMRDVLGSFNPGYSKEFLIRYQDGELVDYYADSPAETFEQMKDNLSRALELVDNNEHIRVDNLEPLPTGNIVLRLLVFYRPEKIVPVYSKEAMNDILEALDLEKPTGYFAKNKKLLDYKNSYEVFSDWTNYKFMRFIWDYKEGKLEEEKGSEREFREESQGYKQSIDVTQDLIGDFELEFDELYFPDGQEEQIVSRIEAALNAGKHIIFTGPPGTGKTEIAELVGKYLSGEVGEVSDPNVTGYQLTTATSDWSTFDTVGGYMPKEESGDLQFNPGHVLRRFKHGAVQRNEILIIDEINRSDIDKAFGQLFTVLSGQEVQLPFRQGEKELEVEIVPGGELERNREPEEHEYIVPESWRILATMNTFDKTSLYEMSYAFMRRFAFIEIPAPEVPDPEEREDEALELLDGYLNIWNREGELSRSYKIGLLKVWHVMNGGDGREIGPALVQDMVNYLSAAGGDDEKTNLSDAVASFVLPQLEGVPGNDEIVEGLVEIDELDGQSLKKIAGKVLR